MRNVILRKKMRYMEGEIEGESRFFRRKRIAPSSLRSTSGLNRCLSTFDLTTLGIGATLGVGIYVLSGSVAKEVAGPSIVISFLIAGVVSALSGLCYAELGSRVPLAGSAYVYSYVSVGEIVGFIIGWNLILEYAIGTASVARAYSGYLDSLINQTISNTLKSAMPISVPHLSPYPDLFAFTITLILTWILASGVKESTRFNSLFTILNLSVVVFVIIVGMLNINISNWGLPAESIPNSNYGVGGFFPYGISGTLAGAATCFYGFVGFDAIATSGEEAQNPQRSIPLAIIISLVFVFFSYFGVSSVLTLMVPYYLQDPNAPLPHVFKYLGLNWIGTLVSLGALLGLSSSLLGAMFPLPRIIYAMSTDGLLFRWLGVVHPTFRTPLRATLVCGTFSALMATLFELKNLVEMMSIGTLMAYTLVGMCVTILRFVKIPGLDEDDKGDYSLLRKFSEDEFGDDEEEIIPIGSFDKDLPVRSKINFWTKVFNMDRKKIVTPASSKVAFYGVIIYAFLASIVIFINQTPLTRSTFGIFFNLIFGVLILGTLVSIYRQPQFKINEDRFRIPFVPFFPALSILCNIYLMSKLSIATWVRFLVWMAIGFLIYGCYGCRNSTEEYRRKGKPIPSP